MTEEQARAELIKHCCYYGWYMVDWHGHFARYFVVLKLSRDHWHRNLTNEIYSAIYESFDDLTQNDEEIYKNFDEKDAKSSAQHRVHRFSQSGYDHITWNETLQKILDWKKTFAEA